MTYTVYTLYAIRGPWYRRRKTAICTYLDWREAMEVAAFMRRHPAVGADVVRYRVEPSQMGWLERVRLNAWRELMEMPRVWG